MAGSILTNTVVVFLLAQRQGRISSTRLILAGVAVSYLFSAVTSFLTLKAGSGDAARRVLFWLLGGLSGTKWADLILPMVSLGIGMVYLLLQRRSLNALLIGEETAMTLGTDSDRFRKQLFLVTSLLTGVMVAVSGAIGFVGLMMPHSVIQEVFGVGSKVEHDPSIDKLRISFFLDGGIESKR